MDGASSKRKLRGQGWEIRQTWIRPIWLDARSLIRAAEEFATTVLPIVQAVRKAGASTLAEIAEALNERSMRSADGGRWHRSPFEICWRERIPAKSDDRFIRREVRACCNARPASAASNVMRERGGHVLLLTKRINHCEIYSGGDTSTNRVGRITTLQAEL